MKRKSYEASIKAEAVKVAKEMSVRKASLDFLGIAENTIRNWIKAS